MVTRLAFRSLFVTRRLPSRLFLGQEGEVSLVIENRSRFPLPWLRLEETAPPEVAIQIPVRHVLSLRGRQSIEISYPIHPRRRGDFAIGPTLVAAGDPFGFGEERGQVREADRLIVYPRVILLARAPLNPHAPYGSLRSRHPLFSDPFRHAGKRDYTPGDPLRTIDWKSSARQGGLLTRKVEQAVAAATIVVLNLDAGDYPIQHAYSISEWSIVVAASVISYLGEVRQPVGLGSNGRDSRAGPGPWLLPPHAGREQTIRALERLARAQLAPAPAFGTWLLPAVAAVPWGTTVVAVTPAVNAAVTGALHAMARSGLNPVLLVTLGSHMLPEWQRQGQALGFSVMRVAGEADLASWRTLRQA